MVCEEKVCREPYTICRMVPREHCKMVPHTTCRLEAYCETQKVCRRVPICVPVCEDPCTQSFAAPPPAIKDAK
jgi:hypothetical protein